MQTNTFTKFAFLLSFFTIVYDDSNDYDALISSLLISGVGKSSLIKQYICEMDPSEIAPTVGVSFSTFKIKLEDGKVKMQVKTRFQNVKIGICENILIYV